MYFEIKPNSKLARRLQSIANHYRNSTGTKGRIERWVDKSKKLRITVSKNNLLGVIYVGDLVRGKEVHVGIEYGKLEAHSYTLENGLVDCIESQARNYLTKLLDKYFSHIPAKVELNPVMRIN